MTPRPLRASLSATVLRGSLLPAVFTLFAGLAFAQVGPNPVQCTSNVTVTPIMRGEGFTEPAGDITLTCTGGAPPTVGSVIPQVNITVFYNTAVTSRLLPQSTVSEALLLIDEPGSGLIPPVAGFGPAAPQNLCATPLLGCQEFVSQASGINVATDTAQGTAATTPGRNVFQGVVNGNSITFFGVPVLAPGGAASRVFRITNVRVNATPLTGTLSQAGLVQASFSISGASSLIISNPNPLVALVANSLTTSVSGSAGFDLCSSQNKAQVTTLSFAEAFGTAFKTRVTAQDNILYAGQNGTPGTGGFTAQNVPGGTYNSESGFVLPVGTGQTAGLTGFGTRLKAQFNNVPLGTHLFVSVANVQNNGLPVPVPAVIGGSVANGGTSGFAQLTGNEAGVFGAVTATSVAPGDSGSVPIAEIPLFNGSGTAVWEVVNTNPNAIENFRFAVYASYTANPTLNSPPPGTATVNLSYAPTPPSFSAASGAAASDTLAVPRFVADPNSARLILTITSAGCAGINSPTPGTILSATSVTFAWSSTVGADQYWLDVGTSPGVGDISAGATTSTSRTVAGLPCDGRTIYVQLYAHINSSWQVPQRYTYTAVTGCFAQIVSPVPSTTLPATSATFTWTAAAGADQYWLDVGSSPGNGGISAGATTNTSQTVTGLPCDGRTLYVQLYTHLNGAWQVPQRYTYTALTGCFAQIVSPAPSSTLSATSTTFGWSAAAGADQYWLDVGSSLGNGGISAGPTANTSVAVTGLPCDGRTIYVQLYTHLNGAWQVPQRYTYTASNGCASALAQIISPVPLTALPATSVTFSWSAAAGADQYWLDVGSSLGNGGISAGATPGTSKAVAGLPCDGRTLYVQLYTHVNGVWQVPQRYTYTASNGCATALAQIVSPVPATTLSAPSATFSWSAAAGADQYWLDVGSSLANGGISAGPTPNTSKAVTGLPCDGRTIYVQLYTHFVSGWQSPQRYTYTAPLVCTP